MPPYVSSGDHTINNQSDVEPDRTKGPGERFYDRRHSERGPQATRQFTHFAPWARLETTLDILGGPGTGERKILDIGCGDGTLLSRLGGGDLYGVDISETILEHARGNVPNGSFGKGNAKALDFDSGTFDVTISTEVIEHLRRPEAAIREAARVTKEGGTILISVPVASWYRVLMYRVLGRAAKYLDEEEHLREYSLVAMRRFTRVRTLMRDLEDAGLAIASIRGAYILSEPLEGLADRLLEKGSLGLGVLAALDRFLGRLPVMKYLGRYLIMECRKRPRT